MLWIALELPSLPLQLAERGCNLPTPLVIVDGPAQRPVVSCANEPARAAGVREGQAVAAARALAGNLRTLARDPLSEQAALEGLAGWACQFSPAASVDGQGIVLEIGASLRLFGGHAKLTAAIANGVRELGYRATLGVAPTPLAARLFARAEARGMRQRACFTLEELPARTAGLPLLLFDWTEKALALLSDLGVLRIRDALALPRAGFARRFGPEIVADLDRLLGHCPDPRTPHVPPERFRARLELPAEVEATEALLFPLRRLLAQMEGFLRGRGAGVLQLELALWASHGPPTRVALAFASPEREAGFIFNLAREKLGRARLAAPALVIDLRADVLLPYRLRSGTWIPGKEEQALGREHLVQRLAARLGSERVFGIALADDHRPERGWKRGQSKERGQSRNILAGSGPKDISTLTPFFTLTPGSRPTWLLQRPQRLVTQEGEPALQGKLAMLAGPERIEAGWWEGEPVSRDYFVTANPGGETFWVYREHRDPGAWYVHGVFS